MSLSLGRGSTNTRKDWSKQVWGEGLEHKCKRQVGCLQPKAALVSKRGGWHSQGGPCISAWLQLLMQVTSAQGTPTSHHQAHHTNPISSLPPVECLFISCPRDISLFARDNRSSWNLLKFAIAHVSQGIKRLSVSPGCRARAVHPAETAHSRFG